MTKEASYTDGPYNLVPLGDNRTRQEVAEHRASFKGTKYKRYRATSLEYSLYYTEEGFNEEHEFLDFWYSGDPYDLVGTQLPRYLAKEDSTHFTVYQVVPLVMINDFISRDEEIVGDIIPIKKHELSEFTTEQLTAELANREGVSTTRLGPEDTANVIVGREVDEVELVAGPAIIMINTD